MNEYLDAWHRYAQFDGRTDVRGYWMFFLMNAVFLVTAHFVGCAIGLERLPIAYNMATLIPGLSITTRRLHDTGRSGFWQLLWLIPVLGWALMIAFLVKKSKP